MRSRIVHLVEADRGHHRIVVAADLVLALDPTVAQDHHRRIEETVEAVEDDLAALPIVVMVEDLRDVVLQEARTVARQA